MTGAGASPMVDVAFHLKGSSLPRDHGYLISCALLERAPWIAQHKGVGVHNVNLAPSSSENALLSLRSRLVLRAPRSIWKDLAALEGTRLQVGPDALQLGAAYLRELLPHTTLYAHFVDSQGAGETQFIDALAGELETMGIACDAICGRERMALGPQGPTRGFGLMLHALDERGALCVLERGLGPNRSMGAGLFAPHKSASSVGALAARMRRYETQDGDA